MVPGSHIGCLVFVCTSLFIIALGCIFGPGRFEPLASRSRGPLSQTHEVSSGRQGDFVIEDSVPLSVNEPHDRCATARSMR